MNTFCIRSIVSFVVCATFVMLFVSSGVLAAQPNLTIKDQGYAATYVSQSIPDPVAMKPGETKTIVFRFKNTGTETWDEKSSRFLSAFTVEPKYRISLFRSTNWVDATETSRVRGIVAPGAVGELSLTITAPVAPGKYREEFFLAAQNYSWVKGGYFFVDVVVQGDAAIQASTQPKVSIESTPVPYQGKRVLLSKKTVSAVGGEPVKLVAGIKNTGTSEWKNISLRLAGSSGLSHAGNAVSFADASWKSAREVIDIAKQVPTGGVLRIPFVFRTPASAGTYTVRFEVVADGTVLPGVEIVLPVVVTTDAPAGYMPPTFAEFAEVKTPRLSEEPKIRVGLTAPEDKKLTFISTEDAYTIWTSTSSLVGILPAGTQATLRYENGIHSIEAPDIVFSSTEMIRLVPQTLSTAVFTLPSYARTISGRGTTLYNKYRGTLEWRVTMDGSLVYAINELPMEYYMKGIAESTNSAPMEYQKALLTAARTYAYYVAKYTSKHSKRNFDVVAHTGDQLYLGYVSEVAMPQVAAAVDATRGTMMTYNGEVVITPYFGNSDGRTRNWTEVWGGSNKPWLQSVSTEYDLRDNKKLWGHGVGMSARDAAYRAYEGGALWTDILKHYYTGINLEYMYL